MTIKGEKASGMTDAEWLTGTDPAALLAFLRRCGREDGRMVRLFGCACVRRVAHLLADERSLAGLQVRERYELGLAAENELLAAAAGALRARHEARAPFRYAPRVADRTAAFAPIWAADAAAASTQGNGEAAPELSACAAACASPDGWSAGYAAERAHQAELLRDLAGNPFRAPFALGVYFRRPEVIDLAKAICADESLSRLPELADALERLGFDDAGILAHLRGPGLHVRGCFVLEGVLANSRPDPAEERPWEQPGAFRLDFEPHRGFLLNVFAVLCALCGLASFVSVLPALLGLPASVAMWQTVQHDLGEIAAGRMDPHGQRLAEVALDFAGTGIALNLLGLVHAGLFYCFFAFS